MGETNFDSGDVVKIGGKPVTTGTRDFTAIDCSGNPNYPLSKKGDTLLVSVAGKIGGASGDTVEVGDEVKCIADSAAGTKAAVGANFTIINKNITIDTDTAMAADSDALVPSQKAVKARSLADAAAAQAAAIASAAADATSKANAALAAAIAAAAADVNASAFAKIQAFNKATTGPTAMLPAQAFDRVVQFTVKITETFGDGDGTKPSFNIGETDTLDKFKAALAAGTAGDVIPFAGTLSATKELMVSATPATGTTSTGAIEIAVSAVQSA